MLATSRAAPWLVTLQSMCYAHDINISPKDGTDRQTDGQTPD